jgi:cytoskeleton protein RodZ
VIDQEHDSQDALERAPAVEDTLQRVRERHGLTLEDVAYALKLTPRQVEALESERFDRLPGPAFARGFLRNYARLLGLDPAPLLARFEASNQTEAVSLAPLTNAGGAMPIGQSERRRSAGPLGVLVVVLLAAVVAGWYFDWFRPPAIGTQSDASPAQPGEVAVPVMPPDGLGDAQDAAGMTPQPGEVLAPQPVVLDPGPAAQTASAPPAPAQPAAVVEDEETPTVPAGMDRVVFRLERDAWLEVKDGAGKIIFSRVGKAGSVQEVQGAAPLALVVGNAAHVTVEHDGQAVDLAPYIKASVARLTVK